MFPDPTTIWRPFPSIIDGIERPPLTSHLGLWRGVLHLIVVAPGSGLRAYGLEIECEIHAGFDEMIYSIADHGEGATYDGGVYIKEAERSALISAYAKFDPTNRMPRHFLFVGNDYCYEVLSFSEPVIRAFDTPDEAYAWGPQRDG